MPNLILFKPDMKRMIASCMTCPGGEYLHPTEAFEILERLQPETLAQIKKTFKEFTNQSEVIKWLV